MKYLKVIFLSFFVIFFSSCTDTSVNLNGENKDNYEIYEIKNKNTKIFHGYVKAQHLIDLSFQSEGKIIEIPVTIGDYVKKGQLLARLDGILYKIQKQEELARLNEARIRENRYSAYFKRVDILHKAGAISDNDWDEAYFNLKTATQDIAIQKEKINYIEQQISYNELRAPYDGYIYEKKTDAGAYASLSQPILTMITSNKTEVDTMVDSSVVNYLKTSLPVKVLKEDVKYFGSVAHFSKSSLNTGGYLVRIYLDKLYPDLKEGMSVDVEFNLDKSKILIPLKFLKINNENKKFVYKIKRQDDSKIKIEETEIETGILENDLIEIKKGLITGDEIIISPNGSSLKNGKIIKL